MTRRSSALASLPRGVARRTLYFFIEHLRAHPRRRALVARLLARSGGLGARIAQLARSTMDDALSGVSMKAGRDSQGTTTTASYRVGRQGASGMVDTERLAIARRMQYIMELERRIDELEGELRHRRA